MSDARSAAAHDDGTSGLDAEASHDRRSGSRQELDRLRIVAVVGDFPVVSKTFVVDQLLGLLEAGHDVQVLADPPLEDRRLPDEELPGALRSRITYRTRPASSPAMRRRRGVGAGLRGLARVPRETLEVARAWELPRRRRQDLLETMIALHGLGDPDIYHCHFGMLGSDVLAARDRLGFTGRVATAFHGYDISRHIERRGPDAFDALFERGDLFLPISEHWRRRILELGAPADRVQLQRMGVDTSRLEPVARTEVGSPPLRILSVGRFVEKKGFEDGLQAVALLRDRGVEVEYSIIGDGPRLDVLTELVSRLDLHEQVRLPGSRSRAEVLDAMRDHDVLLCPSHTASDGDAEGIPVVLMEAMATAMPVVSTWHSGIPELVEDERSGLLAAERDALGLADRLLRIADEPELAARLGRDARMRVEAEFDVTRLLEQLDQRFLQLVGTPAER